VKWLWLGLLAVLTAGRCGAEPAGRERAVTSASVPAISVTNDPVEQAYEKLMTDDDAALKEIDGWIQENRAFAEKGAGVPNEELNRRIMTRLAPIRKAYEDFLQQHPNHSRARLAYASFLEDIHQEDAALAQMLKAKEVDPKNPAVWNNLANYYGHYSPVTNAFAHYEKAIELDPKEPVYYHNFGTTVFLFRKDAMAYYGISEQQVFDKALMLYSNALSLDPTNFLLATDIAMTYYGIKPPRSEAALAAWNYALKLADGSLAREGVFIHLARTELNAGRYAAARRHLDAVTHPELSELRDRVRRNVDEKEREAAGVTNHPAADVKSAAVSVGATNAPAP
jgi:tetratricopeptide (TPR) repeat protein